MGTSGPDRTGIYFHEQIEVLIVGSSLKACDGSFTTAGVNSSDFAPVDAEFGRERVRSRFVGGNESVALKIHFLLLAGNECRRRNERGKSK